LNKLLIYTSLILIILSCKNSNKEFIDIFQEECTQFYFGITENKFLECSAFQLNYPLNWEYKIENTKNDTTYVLVEILDTTNILELTDEKFDNKYNNFQTISITFGEIYKSFDYVSEFETVYQQISTNKQYRIKESGNASFNSTKTKWIVYNDNSYKKDKLECESVTTCILNSKYYMRIVIQTFGNNDVELRKCKAMEIIKTLKIKV